MTMLLEHCCEAVKSTQAVAAESAMRSAVAHDHGGANYRHSQKAWAASDLSASREPVSAASVNAAVLMMGSPAVPSPAAELLPPPPAQLKTLARRASPSGSSACTSPGYSSDSGRSSPDPSGPDTDNAHKGTGGRAYDLDDENLPPCHFMPGCGPNPANTGPMTFRSARPSRRVLNEEPRPAPRPAAATAAKITAGRAISFGSGTVTSGSGSTVPTYRTKSMGISTEGMGAHLPEDQRRRMLDSLGREAPPDSVCCLPGCTPAELRARHLQKHGLDTCVPVRELPCADPRTRLFLVLVALPYSICIPAVVMLCAPGAAAGVRSTAAVDVYCSQTPAPAGAPHVHLLSYSQMSCQPYLDCIATN